jgi:hypothetical protein
MGTIGRVGGDRKTISNIPEHNYELNGYNYDKSYSLIGCIFRKAESEL